MANRLRTLLIGGVLLFVAIVVPIGLLIYSSDAMGDWQQNASGGMDGLQQSVENANLKPLAVCADGGGGHRGEVLDDDSSGEKLVFVSGRNVTMSSDGITSDNPDDTNIEMHVVNADGSGLTQLTRTTATEFGILNRLPDGREVTLLWSYDGRKIESMSYVDPNVVESQDNGEYGVYDSENRFCSPDDKKLASVTTTTAEATDDDSSAPPADTDISVRTSAGTTDLGDPSYDYSKETSPSFSPDSEKLAFQKDSQVYVANADGSDQRQLTNNFRYTSAAGFSPDSKKLAFVTDTPGGPDSTDLYVINVDGTNLTRLTHNTKRFGKGYSVQEHIDEGGGILFSPDSEQIAFVRYQIMYTPPEYPDPELPVRYDMYVVNVDGTGLTRLTHTEAQEELIISWVGG